MKKFEIGETYFQLGYYDLEGKLPSIKTLVFIGMDVFNEEAVETWCFQWASSVAEFGLYPEVEKGSNVAVELVTEETIHAVFTKDELIYRLEQGLEAWASEGP
ncbi:hypothetical protein R50073_01150 [Maricurvus nonylphenolicus]|uniref:hypothetical protein n=1 Tax=Maricurvus nonylphenolicus TaxID=1008307 RepID=UPI0036F291AF